MTETKVQRAVRLAHDSGYIDGFKVGVCPLCGVSALISKSAGGYCYNCHKQIDKDEVIEHDRS